MIVLALALALQCPDGAPPPCASRARAAGGPAPTSVAVLYFDNTSRDSSETYLADGLTDELITRLGQLDRLQVKARSAVRRFRGVAAPDPAAVGRTLGVANLVSGSVRREGTHVRVTVELTRAATGAHVWGDVLDRTSGDLMAMEAEIASAIATQIGGRLAPAERRTLSARPTAVPEAYDDLLRGDFLLAHRNAADARRALTAYESAVRRDSTFVRAWAHIGLAYYLFVDWNWPYPGLMSDSLLARGIAAASRALALDSMVADGWMARGLILGYTDLRHASGAVEAMQRAVALDPRNAEAWHQLAGTLSDFHRDEEADAAYQRALALDPQRMITLANLATMWFQEGRDAEAETLLDSAVAVAPDAYYPHALRGRVRLHRGNLRGAREEADAALRLRPPTFVFNVEPLVVMVMAAEGDTAGARARAERLAHDVTTVDLGTVRPDAALAFMAVGDRERALSLLEQTRPGGIKAWVSLADPAFAPLHGDARYERLLADLAPR